jgi:glycine betaine/choline ABC-type transport system substrate-binding protein/small-conductance mechanosensitive channel
VSARAAILLTCGLTLRTAGAGETPDAAGAVFGKSLRAQMSRVEATYAALSAARARGRRLQRRAKPASKEEDLRLDADTTYSVVKQRFDGDYGLVWLGRFGFNDTYVLVMRRTRAHALGIKTISDLAEYARSHPRQLKAGFDEEFVSRSDGYQGLKERYAFEFATPPRVSDLGSSCQLLAAGDLDVVNALSTDGRLAAYDLVVLDDDRGFFPPYEAAPVVRRATLDAHDTLADVLNRMTGKVSDEAMRDLCFQVDEKGDAPEAVARRFLLQQGLIEVRALPSLKPGAELTVGGKYFTEQDILVEMTALMIEHGARVRVVRRPHLGGTMACFRALRNGDLDLYVEYSGTGVYILNRADAGADDTEERNLQLFLAVASGRVTALKAHLAAEKAVLAALEQADRYVVLASGIARSTATAPETIERVMSVRQVLAVVECWHRKVEAASNAWSAAASAYRSHVERAVRVLDALETGGGDRTALQSLRGRLVAVRRDAELARASARATTDEADALRALVSAVRGQSEAAEALLTCREFVPIGRATAFREREVRGLDERVACLGALATQYSNRIEMLQERRARASGDALRFLRRDDTAMRDEILAADATAAADAALVAAASDSAEQVRRAADEAEWQAVRARYDAVLEQKRYREDLKSWVVAVVSSIVIALLTVVIAGVLRRAIKRWEPKMRTGQVKEERERRIHTPFLMVRRLIVPLIYFIGVVLILMQFSTFRQMGIAFLASAGVVGVVVGMAARSTLANAIAGVTLCLSQPIRVGDTVMLGDEYGTIEEVGLIYTTFRTWDDRRVMIPNEIMSDKEIVNYSIRNEKVWVKISVPLDYSADVQRAREILSQTIRTSPFWNDKDQPEVWFVEGQKGPMLSFTDTCDTVVKVWAAAWAASPASAWALRSDVLTRAIARMRAEGLSLPQRMTIQHANPLPQPPAEHEAPST